VKVVFNLLRINQWVKNLFILLPVFFGMHFDKFLNYQLIVGFLSMSFIASSVYIINDIVDKKNDSLHPKKKKRPIASGAVTINVAIMVMGLTVSTAMILAFLVDLKVLFIVLSYFIMNLLYCFWLKRIAIVDVIVIAIGFVLRVVIGSVISGVIISKWLMIMIFLLTLTLALGKRRDDVLIVEENSETMKIRKSLEGYNLDFLNTAILMLIVISIICYIMYTVSPEVTQRLSSDYLYITSFPVLIGFIRYLQLAYVYKNTGSPTKLFLTDSGIRICLILWVISFILIAKHVI
jgi:4-hydroxybenzoate polyprenyltransferase